MKDFSIISVVMNRPDRIQDTVNNWLVSDRVREVVLVDWSSSPPVAIDPDPRVRVIRVEEEPYFILTLAFNLAASLASYPLLVKMDIDYRVDDRFFKRMIVAKGTFLRGNSKWARDLNERSLNGFMAIRAEDFWNVGGYNERLFGYGMEDWDLYRRLVKSGLSQRFVHPSRGLRHLAHDDYQRVSNMQGKDADAMQRMNELISLGHQWSKTDERVVWTTNGYGSLVRYSEEEEEVIGVVRNDVSVS